jgi:predicted porin
MKKVLLATSALLGVVALSGAALAQPAGKTVVNQGPTTITLGGTSEFQAGFVDQDRDAGTRGYGFRNDNEIKLNIDNNSDNGLNYGATVVLETDITDDADNEGTNASRTFIYLGSAQNAATQWGRFELGGNVNANAALKVDASTFARATGGVDGDYYFFTNTPVAVLDTPDSPLNSCLGGGCGATENATKLTYYTPVFSGFQLGLSYTPDSNDRGQVASRLENNVGGVENVFSGGVKYEGAFQQVGVKASLTGETGENEVGGDDTNAYAFGLNLSYMNFTFGGSWGEWNDAFTNGNDAEYWTLGAGYTYGAFGVSATYLDSELDLSNTDFSNLSLGADYALAPGLTPYVEVSFFESDAPGAVNDNDGTVLLVGTQLSF